MVHEDHLPGRGEHTGIRLRLLLGVFLLVASLSGSAEARGVVINEIFYHPPGGSWLEFVELYNAATYDIDVSGWAFTNGILYTIPSGTAITAGGYLVVAKHPDSFEQSYTLTGPLVGGFDSSLDNAGDRVELSDASGTVIDSVRYDDRFPWPLAADGDGASIERLCADAPSQSARNWVADSQNGPTPGRANNTSSCPPPDYVVPPVVVNEIFYHPTTDDDADEEFVEIKNTTDAALDISGWSLSDGVEFVFPSGTTLPPAGILVVAANLDYLQSAFGVTNVVGNFTGNLSNDGERVALTDDLGSDVDAVVYLDKGEWPASPDGLGKSLEKIKADEDGSDPASWSASTCSGFSNVEMTGQATSSRLYIYLEGEGEAIIDDLSITLASDPGQEFLSGGDFEEEPAAGVWSFSGNHIDTRWQPSGGTNDGGCLRIVSNGIGGSSSNSASRYTTPDLTNGTEYKLRFKFQPLSGTSTLVARLSSSSQTQGIFVRPSCLAVTPGAENSSRLDALPPFVAHARHNPREPLSNEAVQLTAHVRGSDVTRVRLTYEAGSGSAQTDMFDDGAHGDAAAGDGIFGVKLSAFPHNTLVKYRIFAEGSGQVARFPPLGDPSVDLAYYVNNSQPESPLPVYHILINNLNGLGCSVYSTGTFVADGQVYLNVGVRNRGQTACGQTKNNIKVRFNHGRYLSGKRKINLNALWADKSLIREKLQWDLWRDQNQPYCQSWHVRIHNNGSYHGLFVYVENPDKFYLERNGLNPDGNLYKAIASTEQKQPDIAGYMSAYEKKTNENDDFTDLAAFVDQLNDTAEASILSWFHNNLEIESMIDYQAVVAASANVDHGHKNHYLFHDTEKSKWSVFIWDLDLSLGRTYVQANYGVYNDEIHPFDVNELYAVGWNSLITRFFNAKSTTTPGTSGYFRRALYGRLWAMLWEKCEESITGAQAESLRELLQEEQALDITKWGRYPSRPAAGDPPHPADFNYNVDELLDIGAAEGKGFLHRHLDFLRSRLSSVGFRGFPWVRITEIMYNPGGTSEDLEFLELHNTETKAVDISGWYVDTVGYQFAQGTTMSPGETIVLSKNPTAFAQRYLTATARVFGPYPGNLDNEGDAIRVLEAKPSQGPTFPTYYPLTIDFVRYGDKSPWTELADGSGSSLELVDIDLDNDYPTSWMLSRSLGGSPGSLDLLPPGFLRGDADSNRVVNIADVIRVLGFLFLNASAPGCLDACDTNDSGAIDISDAVSILFYLFAGGEPPSAPGPEKCGADPTPDPLPACLPSC